MTGQSSYLWLLAFLSGVLIFVAAIAIVNGKYFAVKRKKTKLGLIKVAGAGMKLDDADAEGHSEPAAEFPVGDAGAGGKPAESGAAAEPTADDDDTFAVHDEENTEYEETIAVPLNMLADAAEDADGSAEAVSEVVGDDDGVGDADDGTDSAAVSADDAAASGQTSPSSSDTPKSSTNVSMTAQQSPPITAQAPSSSASTSPTASNTQASPTDVSVIGTSKPPISAPASPSNTQASPTNVPMASKPAPPSNPPMPKPTAPPPPIKSILPVRRIPETVKMKERKVILAEDVEVNRELIEMYFEGSGVKFEFAVNGQEVCDKFAGSPGAYSLILMDIQMPIMDGYEATRKIRSMDVAWAKQIPIIAMTGNDAKEDIDLCFDAGMDDHVSKPIDMPVLQEKVFEIIASNTE